MPFDMGMHLMKEKILTAKQLKQLSEHKYNATETSLLDPYLQPYWNWLTRHLPLWLAPNLITLMGLIINIQTSLFIFFYAPRAVEEIPWWASLLCALGLFVYQSLDAVDGKHARRTNSCNPLGELFDHGCDSVSAVFVILAVSCSLQIGTHPGYMFFLFFAAISMFYCAHWRSYVSGCMHFGYFDVTEIQLSVICIHLITAFSGSLWSSEIPFIRLTPKMFLFWLAFFLALIPLFQHLSVVLTGGIGKNGSTVAGTSVLSPVLPLSLVILPALTIYLKSTEKIFDNHPCLYALTFGLVAAKVTNRLVVAQMTRSEMRMLDTALIGPAILFLNQYFNTQFREYYLLWIVLLWTIVDLVLYCSQVCVEIAEHLHIHVFKISPPVKRATKDDDN